MAAICPKISCGMLCSLCGHNNSLRAIAFLYSCDAEILIDLCRSGIECTAGTYHAQTSLPDDMRTPALTSTDLARSDTPSFLAKVKNFASAAVSHVAAGLPMCSDEEIVRRHDICLTCEHLRDNACQLCGCPVARVAGYVSKLSWADQECPAGKWGRAQSA
jgi:hypothetical protein